VAVLHRFTLRGRDVSIVSTKRADVLSTLGISSGQLVLLGIVSCNYYDGNVRNFGLKKNLARIQNLSVRLITAYCGSFGQNVIETDYFRNSVSIFKDLVEHPLEGLILADHNAARQENVDARNSILAKLDDLKEENRLVSEKTEASSVEHLATLPGIWKRSGRCQVRRDKIFLSTIPTT
jgi:hypothetical protein